MPVPYLHVELLHEQQFFWPYYRRKKGHGRILSKHTDSTGMPIGILFCLQPSFKNEEKEGVQKLGSTIRIKESRRNGVVGRPLKTFGAWEGRE